jgi:hypothetical protein
MEKRVDGSLLPPSIELTTQTLSVTLLPPALASKVGMTGSLVRSRRRPDPSIMMRMRSSTTQNLSQTPFPLIMFNGKRNFGSKTRDMHFQKFLMQIVSLRSNRTTLRIALWAELSIRASSTPGAITAGELLSLASLKSAIQLVILTSWAILTLALLSNKAI